MIYVVRRRALLRCRGWYPLVVSLVAAAWGLTVTSNVAYAVVVGACADLTMAWFEQLWRHGSEVAQRT